MDVTKVWLCCALAAIAAPAWGVETFSLTVSKVGNGNVQSFPAAGILCGTTCTASFDSCTTVSLHASPPIGFNFYGWSGDCASTFNNGFGCNVEMLADRNVTANFSLPVTPPPPQTPSDFNGDGNSDILYRNTSTGEVYRMFMNGLTPVSGTVAYTEHNTAWKIVGDGDFNGDEVTDLLWRNASTGQVYVMPFNSSGYYFGTGAVVATEPRAEWQIVFTPDLNGGGRSDILWWNSTTGEVYAMLIDGLYHPTIVGQGMVYTEPNTAWKIVAVGDFAGSRKTNQLLWRNSTTGELFMLTVTLSGGVFSSSGVMIYQEPNTAWKVIGAPDLDGDGRSDILWRNDVTGQVYGMLMNGATIASQGMIYTEPDLAWKVVAQGDYNGDGKADLLYRNDTTGQVFMILMNGLATGAMGMVYSEPNTAWRLLGPWEYGQQ